MNTSFKIVTLFPFSHQAGLLESLLRHSVGLNCKPFPTVYYLYHILTDRLVFCLLPLGLLPLVSLVAIMLLHIAKTASDTADNAGKILETKNMDLGSLWLNNVIRP